MISQKPRLLVVVGQESAPAFLASLAGDPRFDVVLATSTLKAIERLHSGGFELVLVPHAPSAGFSALLTVSRERHVELVLIGELGAREQLTQAHLQAGQVLPTVFADDSIDQVRLVLMQSLMDRELRDELERLRRAASADPAPQVPGSTMAAIERHAILQTLDSVNGSTARAAEILELSVRTIQYRLHDYGIAKRHPRRSMTPPQLEHVNVTTLPNVTSSVRHGFG